VARSRKRAPPSTSEDPLAVALMLIERGDTYLARKIALAVLRAPSSSAEHRTSAEQILDRAGIPSRAFVIGAVTLLLLAGLALIGYGRY
jgi:hypothetical protein